MSVFSISQLWRECGSLQTAHPKGVIAFDPLQVLWTFAPPPPQPCPPSSALSRQTRGAGAHGVCCLSPSFASLDSRSSRRADRRWSAQWPSTSRTGTSWFCATPTSHVYKLDRSRNTPTFPSRQVFPVCAALGLEGEPPSDAPLMPASPRMKRCGDSRGIRGPMEDVPTVPSRPLAQGGRCSEKLPFLHCLLEKSWPRER